jgi:hypothetical protein
MIDDDKRPDTMKVTASIFLRDADSPTLVDFFQREKRSTFIAPSMKKRRTSKKSVGECVAKFCRNAPVFCRECGKQ